MSIPTRINPQFKWMAHDFNDGGHNRLVPLLCKLRKAVDSKPSGLSVILCATDFGGRIFFFVVAGKKDSIDRIRLVGWLVMWLVKKWYGPPGPAMWFIGTENPALPKSLPQ